MGGIPLPSLDLSGGPSTATAGATTQGSTIYAPYSSGLSVVQIGLLVVAGIVVFKLLKR